MPNLDTAVLVDGENVSRLNMLTFNDDYCQNAIRKFYTSVTLRANALDQSCLDFDVVQTPRIGKESVDRVVGMEMVNFYYQGIKNFYLVSNDYDFGDTAVHFKTMFPDAQICIVADPMRVSQKYPRQLSKRNIQFKEFSSSNIEDLAFRALDLLRRHTCGEFVPLYTVGRVLKEHGFPMKKGKLKKDFKQMGFHVKGEDVRIPREEDYDFYDDEDDDFGPR